MVMDVLLLKVTLHCIVQHLYTFVYSVEIISLTDDKRHLI